MGRLFLLTSYVLLAISVNGQSILLDDANSPVYNLIGSIEGGTIYPLGSFNTIDTTTIRTSDDLRNYFSQGSNPTYLSAPLSQNAYSISDFKVYEAVKMKSFQKGIFDDREFNSLISIDTINNSTDPRHLNINPIQWDSSLKTNKAKANEVNSIEVLDSNAIIMEIETIKKDFRNDLESSLNGLVLADLSKDDLSNRVSDLINSYQENERYKSALKTDKQLVSKLSAYGENEVSYEWLNNKISYAKIFDEYSPELYSDKVALNKNIARLKTLSNQRSEILVIISPHTDPPISV